MTPHTMTPHTVLQHEFVEFVPDELKEGRLYVCMGLATVIHKCCCGCGNEVVTPLSPTDWKLTYDGETITLHPSIGNWGFACQSHYFIRNNRVKWARKWSQEQVEAGRAHDRWEKDGFFGASNAATDNVAADRPKDERGFWQKLKAWWS